MCIRDRNNRLCVSEHSIHSEKLNASFSAVHLSDLHNKSFGRQNKKLLEKVRELKPDVIFYTGDVIYKRSKYYQTGIRLSLIHIYVLNCLEKKHSKE